MHGFHGGGFGLLLIIGAFVLLLVLASHSNGGKSDN